MTTPIMLKPDEKVPEGYYVVVADKDVKLILPNSYKQTHPPQLRKEKK